MPEQVLTLNIFFQWFSFCFWRWYLWEVSDQSVLWYFFNLWLKLVKWLNSIYIDVQMLGLSSSVSSQLFYLFYIFKFLVLKCTSKKGGRTKIIDILIIINLTTIPRGWDFNDYSSNLIAENIKFSKLTVW